MEPLGVGPLVIEARIDPVWNLIGPRILPRSRAALARRASDSPAVSHSSLLGVEQRAFLEEETCRACAD